MKKNQSFLPMPNCFELFAFSFVVGPNSLRAGGGASAGAESGGGGSGGAGGSWQGLSSSSASSISSNSAFSKAWLVKVETALDSHNVFAGQVYGMNQCRAPWLLCCFTDCCFTRPAAALA